jgi:hypothetical protein
VASAAAQAQQAIFVSIAERPPPGLCEDLDALLEVEFGNYRSASLRLKGYPPEASATATVAYVTRYRHVHELVSNRIDLASISPSLVGHLALLAKRYDVYALKRFAPAKRHAILLASWSRPREICSTAHAFEEQHRQLRGRARDGVESTADFLEVSPSPKVSIGA